MSFWKVIVLAVFLSIQIAYLIASAHLEYKTKNQRINDLQHYDAIVNSIRFL